MALLREKYQRNWMSYLLFFLFIMTFITRAYADAFYNSQDIDNFSANIIKYIFMGTGMFLSFLKLLSEKTTNRRYFYFEDGYKNILVVLIFFVLVSCASIIITNKATILTINGLLYIFLAITYSFLYINCLDEDLFYKSFVIILIGTFIFYGFSIGFSNVTFSNLFSSSFINSSSVLESHYFSGIAFALSAYFCFNRKHIIITIFSVLFCIFTFKRVTIIASLVLFIIPFFVNTNFKVKKSLIIFVKLAFIILPVLYVYIMLYSNMFTDYELSNFTLGRSDFLIELVNKGFVPYGYFSSLDFYKNIEMDLVRILLETSIFGLIIFVNGYFNLAKNSLYSFLLMIFLFINLFFSHSLGSAFTWGVYFIIFGIDSKKAEKCSFKQLHLCKNNYKRR